MNTFPDHLAMARFYNTNAFSYSITDASHFPNVVFFLFLKGVKCSWPDGGLLEVDLHHCQDPVYYHVLLKYPDFGISKNLNVTKGKPQTLYQHKVATVKIQVLKLERTNDIVTTTVSKKKDFINFSMGNSRTNPPPLLQMNCKIFYPSLCQYFLAC